VSDDLTGLVPTGVWVLLGSFLLLLMGLRLIGAHAKYGVLTGSTTIIGGILWTSLWYWQYPDDFQSIILFAYVNPTVFVVFVGAAAAAIVVMLVW
jgi:hypothetical protein